MGREENGAVVTAKVLNQGVDFVPCLWIESGCGLVQEEYLGVIDQRERESESLLLSAGKLGVEVIPLVLQLEPF
jgi:hypothetical protein